MKKLAHATILVHKSVVTSLANPVDALKLSSHPLVTSMLKAIHIKTSSLAPTRVSIWNAEDLVQWLRDHPPVEDSIFQVSRHVAILLLLASGRRLHDLTLLRIDEAHLTVSNCNSKITLWPVYGSKTDSPKIRQSGWELSSSGDRPLDLVFWVRHLINVSRNRRKASPGLTHLFITTRGKVKSASRTVIAGWLKGPFEDLGITRGPGSIRSAVASNNFISNVPLDKILEKSNWRGSLNFFKYYCKTVEKPRMNRMLNDCFKAV